MLKISVEPINSIKEKDTCNIITDNMIEHNGSPTVKILASVGER